MPNFPAAGPLFVPSAAWILQKGIPRNLTSDFDLFLLLDPFLSRQRPGSFKNGLATGAISVVSGATFLKALPRREAVPTLSLSVHSCARGRGLLCEP